MKLIRNIVIILILGILLASCQKNETHTTQSNASQLQEKETTESQSFGDLSTVLNLIESTDMTPSYAE